MKELLSFDDVLITPRFSNINSRKLVNTESTLLGIELKLPVISSNMDTVTGVDMAKTMAQNGAIGCLHRFLPIGLNIDMYKSVAAYQPTLVSVGVGNVELERFQALYDAGARQIVIDVANGASMQVVQQVKNMRNSRGNDFHLMVGNFATGESIKTFIYHLGHGGIDAFKVGIGGGSACLTRVVTGSGWPTLASILDCVNATPSAIVADGGLRTSGDIAKALAAGASVVMLGGMLAGTDETPGEIISDAREYEGSDLSTQKTTYKRYRGSASKESYKVQGKEAQHRTPEGDSFLIPYKGPVASILHEIEGGIRSAMTYVDASNLQEFIVNSEFVRVTQSGYKEGLAHGKL